MASNMQLKSIYDYNVYTDDGQAAIVQISAKDGELYVYQRGAIKRSHSVLLLVKYTSDHLTVNLDFIDAHLKFEIESLNAKEELFKLLGLIFDSQSDDYTGVSSDEQNCWNLYMRREGGQSAVWIRRHVTVHRGYISCRREDATEADMIIELWTDTCNISKHSEDTFSFTSSGHKYSCKTIDQRTSTIDNCILNFETARRQPKRLTDIDIKAVVLGNDKDDDEDEMQDTADDGADDVDGVADDDVDGDPEAQAFFFKAMFPWNRSKKPPRKATDDEEFVMIELHEVLKARAELTEGIPEKETTEKPRTEASKLDVHKPDEGQQKDKHEDPDSSATAKDPPESSPPLQPQIPRPPGVPGVLPPPPPPPPPQGAPTQPTGLKLRLVPTKKLKQVHWEKVSQTRVEKSLWKKVDDVSENLDLKSLEEIFFVKESKKLVSQASTSSTGTRGSESPGLLLDFERAKTLGIVFKRPYDRVLERLRDALSSTTELEVFKVDKLKQIKKLVPTADDKEMYKKQTREKLIAVDRFMFDLCEMMELGSRIDLTLTVLTLPSNIEDCGQKIHDMKCACREITSSTSLREVLAYLRAAGNYLNAVRTGGYGVYGFQVTSVDKLLDIKNTDSGTTVLDWMIQQLEAKNKELLNWTGTLKHVHLCCEMDLKAMEAYVNNMKSEIKQQRSSVERLNQLKWNSHERKYFADTESFLAEQEVEVASLNEKLRDLSTSYASMLEYLCEPGDRKPSEVFSSLSDFIRKFDNARP